MTESTIYHCWCWVLSLSYSLIDSICNSWEMLIKSGITVRAVNDASELIYRQTDCHNGGLSRKMTLVTQPVSSHHSHNDNDVSMVCCNHHQHQQQEEEAHGRSKCCFTLSTDTQQSLVTLSNCLANSTDSHVQYTDKSLPQTITHISQTTVLQPPTLLTTLHLTF